MQLHQIKFREQYLSCVEHNNELFVFMKPVVEGMGLNWKTQHRKLTDGKYTTCIHHMTIQLSTDIQAREHIIMPLRRLNGWLMSISPSKVREDIRNNVIAYQDECDEILFKHFFHELHAETHAAQQNGLEIKQALHARGFTFAMLAEELGCRANVLSAIAYRVGTSRRAATAICKALNKPIEEVFNDVDSYKTKALPKGKARTEKLEELRHLLAS